MNLKRRYVIFFSLLTIFALYVIVRYSLLILNGTEEGQSLQTSAITERGSILDRNGRFLAIQVNFADVSVWRPYISNIKIKGLDTLEDKIDYLSNELGPILDMPADEIHKKIVSSESDFIYLKKQVDDNTARRLSAILEEKKITGAGIRADPVVRRIYPEKNLASQVVGFVANENEGIELAFNSVLSGVENDGKGSQVVLTVDVNVQYILEQIASRTMNETGADAVMFLAMDPRSGDILGSASLPGFDPNNIWDSDEERRMNRPVIWAYEPGSVFKIFTIAALMDCGAISSDSVFYCNGVYVPLRGEPINCLSAHGRVTARDIIINSCNVGAAYASEHINNSAFYDLLRNYGFGSRTGAGSPAENVGRLAASERWSDRSKPTLAFGQEILVSAYQILQAATAIANDGVLVPPKIVSKIISADGKTVTDWKNGESRRILKAETARAMRSYMADTASIGSAWRAAVGDLSLAVKTGTAQIHDPSSRRINPVTGTIVEYSETDYIASCIALLPADAPSLILYLAIIKPKGEIFGVRIAAPAIREAAESLIDYFGIPRGRNPQISHPSSINIPAGRLPAIDSQVPDFTGVAKRILIPLLLRDDINVEIRGDGWVRRQSPPPGTQVTSGMTVILELE